MGEVFKRTSHIVIARVIRDVKKHKKEYNLHYYELLYSKDNERIINDSNRIGEPYYSFSKKTATETMSRIINNKGKITDEVARLIAENMGIPYSKLIWGVHDKGMTQLDLLFYQIFWVELFYDALLSSKYKSQVIGLFKDYIPFTKFIVKNKIQYITKKSELEKIFNTAEFDQIISDATRRFLILAEVSMQYEKVSVWKLYMRYFSSKDNSLKNLSKTIEDFFDFCYEEYFQYVMDGYGNNYGLAAYGLLEECAGMTLTEYEMEHFDNWNDVNLLTERINIDDEEWILKKELVIATYNFVDTLANYQKKIEDITLKAEWRVSVE
ncbi:TPA: hypothetical protein ACGO7R_001127 [Streptococcus suis]